MNAGWGFFYIFFKPIWALVGVVGGYREMKADSLGCTDKYKMKN